jgi:LemA protein
LFFGGKEFMDGQGGAGVSDAVEAAEGADAVDRVAGFAVWDQPWWVWLLLAVLVCWALGANNRIVRLRAAARNAFGLLESQWFMHLAWMEVHASASVMLLDAWARPVSMDLAPFKKALQAAKLKPLDVLLMQELSAAWTQVRSQMEDVNVVGTPPQAMVALLQQDQVAVAAFNQAVHQYNQAIAQFPALLLAKLLNYRPAVPVEWVETQPL